MSADRSSLLRRETAALLRPGEQCAACVDVHLPANATAAGPEGSCQNRLVCAIKDRQDSWGRVYCLVTSQRVMFATHRVGQDLAPLLELWPPEIAAVARRRAWPGWQLVIEFSDASAVSLEIAGSGAGRAAARLVSLLTPAGAARPPSYEPGRTVTVDGVLAKPGGAVTITFSDVGVSVSPKRLGARVARRVGWLSGAGGGLLFLGIGVAAAAAWSALSSRHAPAALPNVAIFVGLGASACLLVWLLVHAAEEALGYAVLGLAIVALPLLLIPGFRRWLGRSFHRAPVPDQPGNQVPRASVIGAQVERRGRTMAVRVGYASGEQVRYLARGRSGRRLAAEWERVCRPDRRRGTGTADTAQQIGS